MSKPRVSYQKLTNLLVSQLSAVAGATIGPPLIDNAASEFANWSVGPAPTPEMQGVIDDLQAKYDPAW